LVGDEKLSWTIRQQTT